MPGVKKEIPKFGTEDEEREFWATHDSTEFIDWSEARSRKLPNLKPTLRTISLRLPASMIEDLKLLANRRDVPYQSLLKIFLAERIAQERDSLQLDRTDKLLRTGIEGKRLIRLTYKHRDRIVEPHDYGIQNGSVKLLAYQIGGSSSGRLPSWRLMETDQITNIQLLDQTFPGGRPTSSGKHKKWDKVFVRVEPAA